MKLKGVLNVKKNISRVISVLVILCILAVNVLAATPTVTKTKTKWAGYLKITVTYSYVDNNRFSINNVTSTVNLAGSIGLRKWTQRSWQPISLGGYKYNITVSGLLDGTIYSAGADFDLSP